MRNRALHDALRDFALEAAALLANDVNAGAELGFDVDEEPGSGPVLYCYRARTSEYIAERWARLAALPSAEPAAGALGSGASAYLRVRGLPGDDAEPALRAMLERLYDDATGFEFPEERFERVYAEVETTLYEHTWRAEIVAPLYGLWLEAERFALADGFSLVRGDACDAPPEAVWPDQREPGGEPNALCVLERDQHSDLPLPLTEARMRFRGLLTGLRLFKTGALAFGPLAWARAGGGAWRPAPLGHSGHLRGEPWSLAVAEHEELRAFLELAAGSSHGGMVGWALDRFEMGLERALDTEALTDHLLALRALLDGSDDTGRAGLSLRLAALCADEGERRAVQRRVELAFALERFVIGGGSSEAYVEAIGSASPHEIAFEVERHLRAILRDMVCGYLDSDLRSAADDLLLASAEPVQIRARDLRDPPDRDAPEPDALEETYALEEQPQPEPPVELPEPAVEVPELAAEVREPAVEVPQPQPQPPPQPDPAPEPPLEPAAEEDADPGVTPSADWDFDEDPASYSAPV